MKINVEIDGQIYQVEVEDIHARPVIAVVEGEKFEVWPEESAPELAADPVQAGQPAPVVSAPGGSFAVSSKPKPAVQVGGNKVVTAPLPGVIVAVLVKPGDAISHGQEFCTLEAMKMKNAIKSSRDGTIDSIEVNVGDQVGHGQVLLTFKD
jgi:biotin carboxyl carrier protein